MVTQVKNKDGSVTTSYGQISTTVKTSGKKQVLQVQQEVGLQSHGLIQIIS